MLERPEGQVLQVVVRAFLLSEKVVFVQIRREPVEVVGWIVVVVLDDETPIEAILPGHTCASENSVHQVEP